MDQSDGRRVSRRKTGRGRALARVRGPDIRRKCGMLRVSRVDTVCGARPAPPRAGRGKTAVPSRSPAAAAVALLCLRWHTFAGMDSVADIVSRASYGCESLCIVATPDSVTSIGDGAFYSCECLPP